MSKENIDKNAKLLQEMERTSKLLVKRDLELQRVNTELDDKIRKLEEHENQLKEVNDILEIRLKARTRQLRSMVNDLDKQVKERTQKIEESRKALSGVLDDISREKSISEEEKEKTLAIIRNFSDGLMVFDSNDILKIINPKAEEYLRVNEIDLIGCSFHELSSVSELGALFSVLGLEFDDFSRKELAISDKLILEVSVVTITKESEHLGHFIILHDITRERTVEKMKSEFVSIAAHQLRTPLTSIKWILSSIISGDFGEMSDEQIKYLKKTYQSNERMINLVNDLLNLSRIEDGRYVQAKNVFDFNEVVQKNIDEETVKFQKKNLKVSLNKPEEEVQVSADKEKITLVVQNLIENAANYSFENGEINISFWVDKEKNELIFQVHDNGIGVPEDQKERIFTKFFRAQNALETETVGSGLGLFINKNIIESHRGRIWFDSNENGTTFGFVIPIGL